MSRNDPGCPRMNARGDVTTKNSATNKPDETVAGGHRGATIRLRLDAQAAGSFQLPAEYLYLIGQ